MSNTLKIVAGTSPHDESSLSKIKTRIRMLLHFIFLNHYNRKKAANIDFFNLKGLVSLKFSENPFMFKENSLYGHKDAIENLGGRAWGGYIEHGVYFNDVLSLMVPELSPIKRKLFFLKTVYTFSERRKRVIEETMRSYGVKGIRVQAVGPYILGSEHFYSKDRLDALKKKLGRVLLVFPAHTTDFVDIVDKKNAFRNFVLEKAQAYDTVLVSIYWKDVINGTYNNMVTDRMIPVCSGLMQDPYFLSRQKDLFYLADMVVTNSVGTHVGYAIALDKPCCIYDSDYIYMAKSEATKFDEIISNRSHEIQQAEGFYDAFKSFDDAITEEQRALVDKWWGRSQT